MSDIFTVVQVSDVGFNNYASSISHKVYNDKIYYVYIYESDSQSAQLWFGNSNLDGTNFSANILPMSGWTNGNLPVLEIYNNKAYIAWEQNGIVAYTQSYIATVNLDGTDFNPILLNTVNENGLYPNIIVNENGVFITWVQYNLAVSTINIASMDLYLTNLSILHTIEHTDYVSYATPKLCISNNRIYVTWRWWYNNSGYKYAIYVSSMNLDGTNYLEFSLTDEVDIVAGKHSPNIQVVNSKLYVAWFQKYGSFYHQVNLSISDTDGNNKSIFKLTDNAYGKEVIDIEVSDKVYLVWSEYIDTGYQVITATLNLNGAELSSIQRTSGSEIEDPQISIYNGNIYYTWSAYGDLNYDWSDIWLGIYGILIHNLTISVTGNGTTNPLPGIYQYEENQIINLSATPDEGYQFDHWVGNVADINNSVTTFTMGTVDEEITAVFTQINQLTVVNSQSTSIINIFNNDPINYPSGNNYVYFSDVVIVGSAIIPSLPEFISMQLTTGDTEKYAPLFQIYNGKIYYMYEISATWPISNIWLASSNLDGTNFVTTLLGESTGEFYFSIINDKIYIVLAKRSADNKIQIFTAIVNLDGSGFNPIQRTFYTRSDSNVLKPYLLVNSNKVYITWVYFQGIAPIGDTLNIASTDLVGDNFVSNVIYTNGYISRCTIAEHDEKLYMSFLTFNDLADLNVTISSIMLDMTDYSVLCNIAATIYDGNWTNMTPIHRIYNGKIYCIFLELDSTNGNRQFVLFSINADGTNLTTVKFRNSSDWKGELQFEIVDDIIYLVWGEQSEQIWTGTMNLDGSNFVPTQRTFAEYNEYPQLIVVGTTIYYTWDRYDPDSDYSQIWLGVLNN